MKLPLSVIVLTMNEALHLERCLKSVADIASELVVIDSGSTDGTADIAVRCGATVHVHTFVNQADQMNWALANVPMKGTWVLRLDADEYLLPELRAEMEATLGVVPASVGGFLMKRRVYFMGRWMRHGGYYPMWILRLWRNGAATCEAREMDEHMVVTAGEIQRLSNDFVDENLNDLSWWTEKHNKFSSREVRVALAEDRAATDARLGSEVEKRRRAKHAYAGLPLFFRVIWYFTYRFVVRLGFLDGKEGLIFHTLQGFWYRFLVDAKIYEVLRKERMAKSK